MSFDRDQLRTVVVTALATAAEIDPGQFDDSTNMVDLGLDSLSFAGVIIDIEDAMGEEVPVEVLDRFLDVGDVVTLRDVIEILSIWEPGMGTPLAAAGPVGPPDRVVVRQPVPGGAWYEDTFSPGERL
jgi:acyl carrier protein